MLKSYNRKEPELKEVSPEDPLEDAEEQAHLKAVVSSFLNYEVLTSNMHDRLTLCEM